MKPLRFETKPFLRVFRKYRFVLLIFVFYLILAVVITYPLVFKFSSSVYSTSDRLIDNLAGIYDLWWYKQVFRFGGSPDFVPLLGLNGLALARFLPYHMVIVTSLLKLITLIGNEVFAFNFLILLSFPLAGLAMYFLAYHVTKNRWASVMAGFIYAFSPLHRRYAHEWMGMSQWHWLPLYALFLLKLDETKSVRWGLLSGLMFAVTFIENYYFGYFAIFFTLAFVVFRLFEFWRREKKFYFDWQRFVVFVVTFLVAAVLTLPITSTFFQEFRRVTEVGESEIPGFVREDWPRFAFSARPWFYVLPDVNHPVFGNFASNFYQWLGSHPPYFITQPFHQREHSLFLGWTSLVLVLLALAVCLGLFRKSFGPTLIPRSRRYFWLFLVLGLTMAVFSGPPFATIRLHTVYFPSFFLSKIFPMFRAYARFGVLVLLCASLLAAFGMTIILGRIKSPKFRALLTLLLIGLVFFEFLDFPPFHNEYIGIDPAHRWLAEQPGDFAVVEYLVADNRPLLQQRFYRKRFINPWGLAPAGVEGVAKAIDRPAAVEQLAKWGVKYLVFRGSNPKLITRAQGYKLVAAFPEWALYVFEISPNSE